MMEVEGDLLWSGYEVAPPKALKLGACPLAILGGSGNFRRWDLAGGSMPLVLVHYLALAHSCMPPFCFLRAVRQ